MEINTTIYDEHDNEIFVTGFVIKGQAGISNGYGQLETPDDEDEIEIYSARDEDDHEIDLTDAQQEEAIENLYQGQ